MIIPVYLSAQIKIDGFVYDFTKSPVNNATVSVNYYERVTFFYEKRVSSVLKTDTAGHFAFNVKNTDKIEFIVFATNNIEKTFSIPVSSDTTIQVYLQRNDYGDVVRKPVIYLYPEKETKVDVKLNFKGMLSNTYPEYNGGWDVLAKPNGDLVNQKDNSKHRYLFWDGNSDENLHINDFGCGFVIAGEDTYEFLNSKLTELGLNEYEKNDFITFWMPILKQNKYNFIHFITNEECDKIATLDVNPKPDSEVRIYMAYQGMDIPMNMRIQILKPIERKGFVLVEWGGFEIPVYKIN